MPSPDLLRKLGLLTSLYFSQGLPFGFFTQALPVLMRERGLSLTAIGLSSLLALPWAFKFLWAPLIDRYGTRRGWIVPLQMVSVLILIALSFAPTDVMPLLLTAVFLVNLVSATQDIATDGLAVDILVEKERGMANGLQVAGYRVGMIVGGGALLMVSASLGMRGIFLTMAAALAVATLPILLSKELPRDERLAKATKVDGDHAEGTRSPKSQAGFTEFLRRPEGTHILALLVLYKFGDALAQGMLRPFLSDLGMDLDELGAMLGTVGFASGLLGALVGGATIGRLGRKPALLLFGVMQALSIGAYALVAFLQPDSMTLLYVVSGAEHFAGGTATAALFTCMMDWSRREASATDYTIQASTVVIATGVATTLSGVIADAVGYAVHFGLSAAMGVIAVAAVVLLFPSAPQKPTQMAPETRTPTKEAP